MITDILLTLVSALINIIGFLFGLISFVVPQAALDAITNAFSYLAYLQAFFPIDTLLSVAASYVAFIGLWYAWEMILWVYSIFPWIGKHARHG